MKSINLLLKFITLVFTTFSIAIYASNVPPHALTAPLPAKSGSQRISLDWLLENIHPNLSAINISWLDKDNIIYSLPSNIANEEPIIYRINVNTGKNEKIANGFDPVTSPNGKWILYAHGKDKDKQVWLMDSNGQNAKKLSNIQDGIGIYQYSYNYAWSPDSSQILFTHQKFIPPWEKIKRPETKIDIIDHASGYTHEIASINGVMYDTPFWLPDGNSIIFTKLRHGLIYGESEDNVWIQSLNLKNKDIKTIYHFNGLQQLLRPSVSLDGKRIAFTYDSDFPKFTIITGIGLLSTNPILKNQTIDQLTHNAKFYKTSWSDDGKFVYALRFYNAYKQLYKISSKTGELIQLSKSPINIINYAISPNGKKILSIGQDAHGDYHLTVSDKMGNNNHDILKISATPKEMALSEVREIEWKSPDYPYPIRGLLILPLNYKEGQKYPLIVDIHGGGVGAHTDLGGALFVVSPLDWQLWAAKGYAVLIPELRSSGCLGKLGIARDFIILHEELEGDIKDVDSGVDFLINQGIADSDRLAIIGHSAGGNRANWLSVSRHRYKAIVSKEGWADNYLEALENPDYKQRNYFYGGSPLEVPQNYLHNSALFNSDYTSTPTLFLQGNPELGGADPLDTVYMLHKKMQSQGVETKYYKYPDEGHVFVKEDNLRDAVSKAISWVDSHIGI